MNEKEILIPATIIKENKDSYAVSIPGIGFNTEKKISKEGVVILEEAKIEIGRKYKMLEYPNLNCPDIQKVKVKDITTTGNGRKIVSYSYNFPFTIISEMDYEEFLQIIEKV